jgi:hypothetical protein
MEKEVLLSSGAKTILKKSESVSVTVVVPEPYFHVTDVAPQVKFTILVVVVPETFPLKTKFVIGLEKTGDDTS